MKELIKMKLSIIVPCYNEEKNIPLILETPDETIWATEITNLSSM